MSNITAEKCFDDRLKIWSKRELATINALNLKLPKNFSLEKASKHEDMHLKIDAWFINSATNVRRGVQIKGRETGDDLLYEICLTVDPWIHGRDFICESTFYFYVDRKGTGRLYCLDPIKELTKKYEAIAKEDYQSYGRTKWPNDNDIGVDLKITIDPHTKLRKLLVFFKPYVFSPLGTYYNLIPPFKHYD